MWDAAQTTLALHDDKCTTLCGHECVQVNPLKAYVGESEAVLRLFTVVKRHRQWHLMIDGHEPGVIRHDDRDFVVNLASEVASKADDTVCVYAEDGRLAYTERFKDGVAVSHT